jgi:hypothetical protein
LAYQFWSSAVIDDGKAGSDAATGAKTEAEAASAATAEAGTSGVIGLLASFSISGVIALVGAVDGSISAK